MHALEGCVQEVGGHLTDLRVQPLAHLDTAVRD